MFDVEFFTAQTRNETALVNFKMVSGTFLYVAVLEDRIDTRKMRKLELLDLFIRNIWTSPKTLLNIGISGNI